jgi:hypothetical protein
VVPDQAPDSEQLFALVDDHERVALFPFATVVGFALRETLGCGAAVGATVGLGVGTGVGPTVGATVGAAVGRGVGALSEIITLTSPTPQFPAAS